MDKFDKALLDFYIDIAPKYSELVNKLIKIINEQNLKITRLEYRGGKR